ncbi:hypothetical protein [Photobacterium aquae]|uniref:hypothetical protein n=1 Tax=Photobacterium aquae TaxID=1195763 RepID=UPI000B28A833|nr:hypothetical protein [Photobacterium aquae]
MSIKSNCIYILTCIIIFFASWENINELRYYVVIPILLLTWVLYFAYNGYKVNRLFIEKYTYSIIIITTIAMPSLFNIYPHKDNIDYSYISFTIATAVKIFMILSIMQFVKFDKKSICKLFEFLLLINVSFFIIQFSTVYLTGYYIDPLVPLTGEPQRYLSGFSIPIIGQIYRPTGFYEEPSTYAAFILCFIACKFYLDKKVDKLVIVSIISMLLTLSVAAIFYVTVLMFFLFVVKKKGYLSYLILILSPVFILALFYFAEARLNAIGDATDIRGNLFVFVFNQDLLEILFGNGILGVPSTLASFILDRNLWSIGVASINDNGIWLYLIIKFGIIGCFLFVMTCLKVMKTREDKLLFLILMTTKLSVLYFSFLFYLMIILLIKVGGFKYERA